MLKQHKQMEHLRAFIGAISSVASTDDAGPGAFRLMQEFEKQYQPPVIHLGRVLSVGDGIARVYGLKSVQVRSFASGQTSAIFCAV